MAVLRPRDECAWIGNELYCSRSAWYDWGRWAALGVIIFVTILFFFIWACISARRRRRRGMQPFMGTGWAAPAYGNQAQYPPPPQYSAPGGDQHWGQNPSYYAPQQGGVELQPPQNVYQAPGGGTTTGTTPAPLPTHFSPPPQPKQ